MTTLLFKASSLTCANADCGLLVGRRTGGRVGVSGAAAATSASARVQRVQIVVCRMSRLEGTRRRIHAVVAPLGARAAGAIRTVGSIRAPGASSRASPVSSTSGRRIRTARRRVRQTGEVVAVRVVLVAVGEDVVGGRWLLWVENAARSVRTGARRGVGPTAGRRRDGAIARAAGVLLIADLFVISNFIFHLFSLFFRHPAKFHSCNCKEK